MHENLFDELKRVLSIIEQYKKDIENLGSKKEGFKSVNKHIELAIQESEEATQKILDNIMDITALLNNSLQIVLKIDDDEIKKSLEENIKVSVNKLTETLTLLEFQDIVSQRLQKISNFISDVEKEILKILILFGIGRETSEKKKEELKEKLEELEWKKDVSQEDVDDILKQFGL
ncbi:protein phosphatase CheZ [Persephonella sp.]